METSSTVLTRFLVISDTHNFQFGDGAKVSGHFRQPVPKADVLLHCGDLTQVGGLSAYRKVLSFLGSIDAELKVIIAGNHDLSLDGEYWATDPDEHAQAMELMKGPLAAEAGVTYLEEGLHKFTLKNGAKFTIYTSPYQPEFGDWAFRYERDQDRFNRPDQVAQGITSIAQNPIPDFPGVDILMTHGPPKDILDWTAHGTAGCDNLLRAVSRARPRMHCFGHIHEGYGATLVKWKSDKELLESSAIETESHQTNCYPAAGNFPLNYGKESLMVNAAIMNVSYKPANAPWLVDLDLPRST